MKDLTNRQMQALNTKSKIYESACRLFSKHDYKDVTIQDICNEARVAVGVFYHYFSSKSAILDECYEVFYEQMVKKIEQYNDVAPIDRIRSIIRGGGQIRLNRGRTFFSLLLKYELSQANYYNKYPRNSYGLIYDAVSNAIKHNILFGDAKVIADDIQKAARGATYEWCVRNDDSYDYEEELIRGVNIILAYYSNQPTI